MSPFHKTIPKSSLKMSSVFGGFMKWAIPNKYKSANDIYIYWAGVSFFNALYWNILKICIFQLPEELDFCVDCLN